MTLVSSTLWVATRTATPSCFAMSKRFWKTTREVFGSRFPVGSSAISTFGRLASERAIATRCCSPPESCPGRW